MSLLLQNTKIMGKLPHTNPKYFVISKAKIACEVSGHQISDHFPGVGEMIQMPKGVDNPIAVACGFLPKKPSLSSILLLEQKK